MLSDAAGENEKVNSTEQSDIRANDFAHRNCKDIQGKDGRGSSPGARPLFQPLSRRSLRLKEPTAALMVEQIFQFVRGELFDPQK